MDNKVQVFNPHSFDQETHFYPKALNSQLHAMISHFFNLDHDRLISRYHHLNPKINTDELKNLLSYESKHFYWGGADLFYVTTKRGERKMVVLETNSCPSGQKSMPPRSDADEFRGYRYILENSFLPLIKRKRLPEGALAVIFDKNYMENSGYAATMAELTGEPVYLISCYSHAENLLTVKDDILHFKHEGKEIPIRAAYRYVTQKPWNRLPIHTKTFIYNSTLVCLSGGRNKLVASKAYELFNSEIATSGLKINFPETIKGVSKLEVPLWVARFGGKAVVKVPYSNAGQGVFTITNQEELAGFMDNDFSYDQFIVQSLIGHYKWSSQTEGKRFYHIGTIPNKKGEIFVADLRMMVYSTPHGFFPCAIYARRAQTPLKNTLTSEDSWKMLGTNLSIKKGENQWETDTSRLMLMDRKDFNTLGIGTDDLIEAFIQTVLSIIAIDKMALRLINKKGQFRQKLFESLDNDKSLMEEIFVRSLENDR